MKTVGYLITAGALLLNVTSANAVTFDWSYTDGGSNVGSGTLTATLDATTPNAYDVQTITGIANGLAINSVATVYSSPDQLVYFNSTQPFVIDIFGLSFFGPDNKAFNISADNIANGTINPVNGSIITDGNPFAGFHCGSAYCLVGPGDPSNLNSSNTDPITGVDVSITLAGAVPEPSTWAMLLLGFASIGFLAYRRKSKPALTAA
jgi:hypothetical protein